MRRISLYLTIVLLSSCSYRVGKTSLIDKYQTISVPYVKGDREGIMTSILIQKLASAGSWKVHPEDTDLTLYVSIEDDKHEHVGYRYFYNIEEKKREKRTVPSEDRVSMLCKISVIENSSGKVVVGPYYIPASVYTDFDPEIDQDNLIRFSMGQLDFVEIARETATIPLYSQLSERIVDYLISYW